MRPTEFEGIDATRAERIAECWRATVPSDEQVALAHQRRSRARATRRRGPKLWLVALVQGFILGIGSLAVASWFVTKVLLVPPDVARAPAPSAARKNASRSNRMGTPQLSLAPVPERAPAHASPPSAAFDDAERPKGAASRPPVRAPLVGPPAVSTLGVSPLDARPSGAVGTAESPSNGPAQGAFPLVPMPDLPSAEGPWERVAEALSAGDYVRADRGLTAIGRDADPAVRDAAELARAELWIGRGEGRGFRSTVERLSTSGQTPLIRRRASALLKQLE
jgi:hypothetical protein